MQAKHKKSGETQFAIVMALLSLFLAFQAFGISGFDALSSPGAFPMAVSAIMVISSVVLVIKSMGIPSTVSERFFERILPIKVVVMTSMIIGYALLLNPIGFLPTSFIFLLTAIKYLYACSVLRSVLLAFVCLATIYIVFRLLFSVLMPEGIVPEREILAWLSTLLPGGGEP